MSNTKMSKKTSGRDKNTETAEKLLQKGRTAYKAEDFEAAAEFFRKAAEQGHPWAEDVLKQLEAEYPRLHQK